jgi:hypothetical protein
VRLIDADVHESFESIKTSSPTWTSHGEALSQEGGRGFNQPLGAGNRADVKTADGTASVADYDLMRRQLLDAYEIDYAVLTGYFYPAVLRMQFRAVKSYPWSVFQAFRLFGIVPPT